MNWKQVDILFWTLLIITRCNDLLIRLKLSLRERLLNLVGKKYFKFTKPQRDREQVIFPVDFLFHLCIYRFHQSFVVMYLKIYSVKFHGNIVMDLVATTNQTIPRGFLLIVDQNVSSWTTLIYRCRIWLKNYYCPFEAWMICLENNRLKLNKAIIDF